MGKDKIYPAVVDHLYLQPKASSSYYASIVKRPYTVIAVSKREITIQEAHCIFPQPRYYDTLPIGFEEDPNGEIVKLHWAPSIGKWQTGGAWPEYAYFGEWVYYPYLD